MKAAIVTAAGKTPVFGDFEMPVVKEGEQRIAVRAAALSNLTRMRASGTHYSSAGVFPAVAGTDGVGVAEDGRRVYFAMPEAPYGSLAEFCPIHTRRMVPVPDALDDVTAAAIANPGMSAWASLVDRAQLVKGETVMVNGATGTAGRIAVQLARYLGAARVIASGRNAAELEELKGIGADVVVPFTLGAPHPDGASDFEEALTEAFAGGVDVVVDYLWGESALTTITTLAKTIGDRPVRFVQVGSAAGDANIALPGTALRSAPITLMGSGVGSVDRKTLVASIGRIFDLVGPAGLQVATTVVPLAQVEDVWSKATGRPRVVFTIG